MDNLANFGIKDDQIVGSKRMKPRGKRKKPFGIECRIRRSVTDGLARSLGLRDWWMHSRYPTRARRDQALAALVKKARNDVFTIRYSFETEYRKVDP